MKIKSFLMIFTMLAISPVLFAQESSSWSDFCDDLVWFKNLCKKKLPVPSAPEVSNPVNNITGADVVIPAALGWTRFGLWVKGFKFKAPIASTKTIFNIDPATKCTELVRLALNNKAYGARLALKNSGKVAAAAYLTGFAWHTLVYSNKK